MSTQLWNGAWRAHQPDQRSHQRAREVVAPTGGIMRGKFPSRKNGRMVHHEGMLELDAIYLFEVSPYIASYAEQPRRYQYLDGDRQRKYTPDFELTLTDGSTVLVEVKARTSLQYEDIAHKLLCVRSHFERSGERFVVLTDEVLRAEPRQTNARMLCRSARGLRASAAWASSVHQRVKHLFPMSLQDASRQLAPYGCDPSTLILHRLIGCDMEEPIGAATWTFNQEEGGHDWFRISQEFGF
jgi:hypothetical protein